MKGRIDKIEYSEHFIRSYKKLTKLEKVLAKKREIVFRDDCFSPALRAHKLKGKLKDCWSFSLTPKLRVLFKFMGDKEVIFFDVGDHSIYK